MQCPSARTDKSKLAVLQEDQVSFVCIKYCFKKPCRKRTSAQFLLSWCVCASGSGAPLHNAVNLQCDPSSSGLPCGTDISSVISSSWPEFVIPLRRFPSPFLCYLCLVWGFFVLPLHLLLLPLLCNFYSLLSLWSSWSVCERNAFRFKCWFLIY